MTRDRRLAPLLAWVVLAVLLRLPQLLSPDLLPDPDEAVLGLMARQMSNFEALPVFFAGQCYGFSLLETGTAAMLFKLFGVSTAALKVAMLLIWVAGGSFLIAAVDRLGGRRAAWIGVFLLATCPGWAEWSMKARGGYLTAFLLCAIALFISSHLREDHRPHRVLTVVLGAVAALVPFAQPVWFPTVIAILVLLFREQRSPRDVGALGIGAGSVVVCLLLVLVLGPRPVWTPALPGLRNVGGTLGSLPGDVFTAFSGIYFLGSRLSAGFWATLGGALWSAALLAVLIRAPLRRKTTDPVRRAAPFVLLGVMAVYAVIGKDRHAFRYLLPLLDVLVVTLALDLAPSGRIARAAIAVFVLVGTLALLEAPRRFLGASRARSGMTLATGVDLLVDHLLARGIHHAYAADGFCQFTLQFRSNERIRTRGWSPQDRLPENAVAVDRALWQGRKTALIGPVHVGALIADRLAHLGLALPDSVESIGGWFFLVEDPGPELLSACLFVLHHRESARSGDTGD